MSYLQVIVRDADNCALTANGYDLGGSQGCLTGLFVGEMYPYATDYFNYLNNEGWTLVSSAQQGLWAIVYTFQGDGAYLIKWKDKRWYSDYDSRNE